MQVVRDVAQGLRFLHTSRPPVFHGKQIFAMSLADFDIATHRERIIIFFRCKGDLKGRNVLIDSHFRAKLW